MTCWILTTAYPKPGSPAEVEHIRTVYRDIRRLVHDAKRMIDEQGIDPRSVDIERSYLVPETGE